jgi:hypothetical protein
MKLIRELTEEVEYIIEEDQTGEKHFYISGPFIQMDVKNGNGRIYPEQNIRESVADYVENFVKQNRAYGELGHPNSPKINLDRVSHRIVSLKQEGKTWVGKAQISSTPMGQIASGLMKDGGKLGVSTRGVGTLEEQGGSSVIQKDFKLCTAGDIVVDPSGPDCFVTAIMENREWLYENGTWSEQQLEDAAKKLKRKFTVTEQLEIFNQFLGKLI